MGYFKYKEDDEEIIDERRCECLDYRIDETKDPSIFICAYCGAFFPSKEALYNHIRNKHNKIESIVFLNQKIIKSNCISFAKNIESIKLIIYDTNLNVVVNNKNISYNKNELELLDDIDDIPLLNKYEIIIGKKSWTIELISADEIDCKKIALTTLKWDQMVINGLKPNKNYGEGYNDLEKKCLDGFYNYYIACNASGLEKSQRYEESYSILNQYAQFVSLARVVLKIIAFKFNWIERLKLLCTNDDMFANIIDFYDKVKSERKDDNLYDKRVFVEDDIESSIQAILNYQKGDISSLNKYLLKYSKDILLNMDNDKNLRDRILLLLARVNIDRKDYHKARRCYEEMQTLYFQTEYNKFLREMK